MNRIPLDNGRDFSIASLVICKKYMYEMVKAVDFLLSQLYNNCVKNITTLHGYTVCFLISVEPWLRKDNKYETLY